MRRGSRSAVVAEFCSNKFVMTQRKHRYKGSAQAAPDARGRGIVQDGIVLALGSNRYKASQSVPDLYYELTAMFDAESVRARTISVGATVASAYARRVA